ncbi:MAG: phosphotransferase [Marmoricola sp.]
MNDRSALGTADVTDDQLTGMVADLLGTDPVETKLLSSSAEEVDYDIAAITTAGRFWVRGSVGVRGGELPFQLFVKHIQAWSRSPLFQNVPVELQPMAAAGVPWRTEPLAYRSDLGRRLPVGLRMPRALGIFDLDELSASVWLEVIKTRPVVWDLDRYRRAGYLLGRVAANPRVRELASVGKFDFQVSDYLNGRLRGQVLPMLAEEGIWMHPLVAGAFEPELRERLLEAADLAPAYAEELSEFPLSTSHGDACPNNLLVPAEDDGFVLIDYGFWGEMPIGFDLSQLLVGDVQVGRRGAGDLHDLEDTLLAAYVLGLRAEGCEVPEAAVRRAHALQLMIFTGLSTLPFEHLGREPTPEVHAIARERAAIARFSLDLLDRAHLTGETALS